jgi:hypothetical protein
VASCPECKASVEDGESRCHVCGAQIASSINQWVLVGSVEGKISADFAQETLRSYEIPVVVISKSGFYGNVGLHFPQFFSSNSGSFEISVRADDVEEAVDLLDMILGDRWQRKENG